jgi:hypothetical protein
MVHLHGLFQALARKLHFEKGLALVGSVLDNRDEIVSTPQDRLVLLSRKGMAEAPDFLAIPGGVTHGVSN